MPFVEQPYMLHWSSEFSPQKCLHKPQCHHDHHNNAWDMTEQKISFDPKPDCFHVTFSIALTTAKVIITLSYSVLRRILSKNRNSLQFHIALSIVKRCKRAAAIRKPRGTSFPRERYIFHLKLQKKLPQQFFLLQTHFNDGTPIYNTAISRDNPKYLLKI